MCQPGNGTDDLRYVKTKSGKDVNRFIINDNYFGAKRFDKSGNSYYTLFFYIFCLLCIYASEDNDHIQTKAFIR